MVRRELINRVKTKVDELSPAGELPVAVGLMYDKPVDVLADELLDESAREVLMSAPLWRLDVADGGALAEAAEDGSGMVRLPDDFLRLAEFRMRGWKRPVREVAAAGSDVALMQDNAFLRGGCSKPVCVFGFFMGQPALSYYSVEGEHRVERFAYVRSVAAELVPADLRDALTWLCASGVLAVLGRLDESKMARERGISLLL